VTVTRYNAANKALNVEGEERLTDLETVPAGNMLILLQPR